MEIEKRSHYRPSIPETAYRPIKRCPNCQSVYLSDSKCEACGRTLNYHPIGEPFSSKSLYGLKERFYATLPYLVQVFPLFENKKDARALSYKRHLKKRFNDLLMALSENESVLPGERRFFYVELLELIDELLRYGEPSSILRAKIEEELGFSGALITQDLVNYLDQSAKEFNLNKHPHWSSVLLKHKMGGVLRVELFLKCLIIGTTVVAVALAYYEIIRSQVGR